MAKPPKLKRLAREDFAGLDPAVLKGLDKLFTTLNPFLSDVTGALSKGITIEDNCAALLADVDLTLPDDWTPITFGTGWTQWSDTLYSNCSIRKGADGQVEVRGLADPDGTVVPGGTNSTLSTLDAIYRPEKDHRFVVDAAGAYGVLRFRSSGVIEIVGSTSTASYVSLYNIRWTAADRTPPPLATPLYVKVDALPGKINKAVVVGCQDVSGANPLPAPIPVVEFEPATQGANKVLKIKSVTGLAPSKKYRLSVLILSS